LGTGEGGVGVEVKMDEGSSEGTAAVGAAMEDFSNTRKRRGSELE
jgi:hypothetical protein